VARIMGKYHGPSALSDGGRSPSINSIARLPERFLRFNRRLVPWRLGRSPIRGGINEAHQLGVVVVKFNCDRRGVAFDLSTGTGGHGPECN
jgi:hypothetical protein